MSQLDRYAVMGQPIKHSKSPRIHRLFAEQTGQHLSYSAEEVSPEEFRAVVADFFANGGKGLNCTVPLKELAWAYAEYTSERARLSKAVNTLSLHVDGKVFGDNTDGVGLITDLKHNHHLDLSGCSILILGAGGATRGIIAPILAEQPKQLVIANRTLAKALQLADDFSAEGRLEACGLDELNNQAFDLIINATSASLSQDLPALPDTVLASNGVCYDLAYANQATPFVQWGNEHGACHSLDGLGMLVEQAAEAFFIWRGVRPETQSVIALLNAERLAL